MHRRTATLAIAAGAGACSLVARAAEPVEGEQYAELRSPQAPTAPGKIDVIEFFSYGCPACNMFDPILEAWVAKLPADVSFRRSPVPFLANAENFQRAFFALDATGMTALVHARIFEAVHVARLRLSTPEEIAEVVAKAGGDRARFLGAFNAFSMGAALARARSAASSYRIERIPTLAIAGRYTTSPSQAGGAQQVLAVADFLLQKARKA